MMSKFGIEDSLFRKKWIGLFAVIAITTIIVAITMIQVTITTIYVVGIIKVAILEDLCEAFGNWYCL